MQKLSKLIQDYKNSINENEATNEIRATLVIENILSQLHTANLLWNELKIIEKTSVKYIILWLF